MKSVARWEIQKSEPEPPAQKTPRAKADSAAFFQLNKTIILDYEARCEAYTQGYGNSDKYKDQNRKSEN